MGKRIAIVGAGTAGLCSAIALSHAGYHVTVFEKHHAPTARGAGLLIQPAGVRALQELGVGDTFLLRSTPIERLLGENHRGRRIVDVRYSRDTARAVSRAALSSVLWEEVGELGVEVCTGEDVHDIVQLSDGVRLETQRGARGFDALVLADGSDSALRERAGLGITSTPYPWGAVWGLFDVSDWPHPTTLLQRYRGTRQMFGLMPTAMSGNITTLSFFWSLNHSSLNDWANTDLSTFRNELMELWPESSPVVEQLHSHRQLAIARYQHAWPRRLGVRRIFVAGDSAHSMSPSLGLGSTLAAQDALAIARSIEKFGAASGPLNYSRERLRRIQAYQWVSRAVTPCFQAERGGWLRDVVFGTTVGLPPVRWVMRRSLST